MKEKVEIQGNKVIVGDEITEYHDREYACRAAWELAWFLKVELYDEDGWLDMMDYYQEDPELDQICIYL